MKKKLALALAFASLGILGAAKSADATVILSFGQNGNVNTITGTNNGAGVTTIAGSNIAVTITQIDAGVATPIAAFLTLSATSTGAASTDGSGQITQHYMRFSPTWMQRITGATHPGGVSTFSACEVWGRAEVHATTPQTFVSVLTAGCREYQGGACATAGEASHPLRP